MADCCLVDSQADVAAVLIVTWLVTGPLLILVHELGHAFAVIRTGRRPKVIVAPEMRPMIVHSFKRFDLAFNPVLRDPRRLLGDARRPIGVGSRRPLGLCQYDVRGVTVAEHRSILRSGPLASALAALARAGMASRGADPSSVLFWILTLGFVQASIEALVNLVPRRGTNRDGTRLRAMQDAPAAGVPHPAPPSPAELDQARAQHSVPPPGYG